MKTILALGLFGLLAGAFLWERMTAGSLHRQNELLRAAQLEAERLALENRELPQLRSGLAITEEQSSLTELLRLRNELRQLHSFRKEAERLRTANQRMAEEIKSGQFVPRRLADMEGAVPREKWTYAGFATPEATVQSFLSALASGDFEQIVRCLPPHQIEGMRKAMTEQPERFRQELGKDFMGGLDPFRKVTAFRIIGVRLEDEKAVVDVQLTADGEPVPFQMYRYEDEWKLSY